MGMQTLLRIVVAVLVTTGAWTSQANAATQHEVKFFCPGSEMVVKTITCNLGQRIWARGTCPDGRKVMSVGFCGQSANSAGKGFLRGDWSLGIVPTWTSVKGGPSLWSGELQLVGDLRVSDSWTFHFQAGPGFGRTGENLFTLSEFVGFQQRFESWSLTLGGRHRVAFWDGSRLNSLMAEAQVRFHIGGPAWIGVMGSLGGAWYPDSKEAAGYWPAGAEVPVESVVGSDLTGSLAGTFELRF